MSHEWLPCKLCGTEILGGQLCDACKGLEHRKHLNGGGTMNNEIDVESLRLPKCQECGTYFAPWLNGAYMQRRFCKPCVIKKRVATYSANKHNHKRTRTEPVVKESLTPEPSNHSVSFHTEPDMAGQIAAMATRERRSFDQQVFWLLDSVMKPVRPMNDNPSEF